MISKNATEVSRNSPIFTLDLMDLSIVIPVFNEEENVKPLIEIEAALNSLSKRYEIVIIDDGSRDSTFQILADLRD